MPLSKLDACRFRGLELLPAVALAVPFEGSVDEPRRKLVPFNVQGSGWRRGSDSYIAAFLKERRIPQGRAVDPDGNEIRGAATAKRGQGSRRIVNRGE